MENRELTKREGFGKYFFYNPIPDIVTDEVFFELLRRGLLNERKLRNYRIKEKYKRLRTANIPAADAIDKLQQEYPYLQFDTIRKIVYK